MPRKPLRVLVLEDSPADAELELHALRDGGFDVSSTVVDALAAFTAALSLPPDLVIADFHLAGFTALDALKALRLGGLDTPFIVVTGTLGDETAAECMRQGADDYLLKDRLGRLGGAVSSALDRHRVRRARAQAERELRESEARFREITQNIGEVFFMETPDLSGMLYVSPAYERIWGRGCQSLYERPGSFMDLIHPDDLDAFRAELANIAERETRSEFRIVRDDGSVRWIRARTVPVRNERGEVYRVAGIAEDVTSLVEAREEKDRLAAIVESSENAIVGKTLDGLVTSWNRGAERLYGYSAAEMIGQPISRVVPPDRQHEMADILGHARRGERVSHFETERVQKDGGRVSVLLSASPIRDHAGDVAGVATIAADVTERKRLQEEHALRSAALAAAANGVMITDREGCITWVNDGFTRLTGYSLEEVVGKNPRLLSSGLQTPEVYADLWTTVVSGRVWHGEVVNRRKDGTTYPEEMSITPVLRAGAITHFIAIKQDVTERKRSEQSLRDALEKAEESDRLKAAFLANMSHEVRTPLNVISGYTALMADRMRELHDETLDECFDAIQKGGQRLLQTVQGIIDLARLESGTFEVETVPLNLAEIVEAEMRRQRDPAAAKHLTLSLRVDADDVRVEADEYCLKETVHQIVDNAVKFTERGGVTLRIDRAADGCLCLEVADSGVGIDDAYLPSLFRPFSQEQVGYTRRFEGPGVGLALVKRYVDRNRQEVQVRSRKGEGTTIVVRFPLSAHGGEVR